MCIRLANRTVLFVWNTKLFSDSFGSNCLTIESIICVVVFLLPVAELCWGCPVLYQCCLCHGHPHLTRPLHPSQTASYIITINKTPLASESFDILQMKACDINLSLLQCAIFKNYIDYIRSLSSTHPLNVYHPLITSKT